MRKPPQYVVVPILIVIVYAVAMFMAEKHKTVRLAQERADNKFAGACEILGGNVHDDLCIKGNTVILRQEK